MVSQVGGRTGGEGRAIGAGRLRKRRETAPQSAGVGAWSPSMNETYGVRQEVGGRRRRTAGGFGREYGSGSKCLDGGSVCIGAGRRRVARAVSVTRRRPGVNSNALL